MLLAMRRPRAKAAALVKVTTTLEEALLASAVTDPSFVAVTLTSPVAFTVVSTS